jgi:hypothetical protein
VVTSQLLDNAAVQCNLLPDLQARTRKVASLAAASTAQCRLFIK